MVIWTVLVLRPPVIQALLKGGQDLTRDRNRPEEFRGHLGELLEQRIDFVNRRHRLQGLIGKAVVAVSEDFYRPTDVVNLWGDPTKAKAMLGWNPNKTSFEELVKLMVESDMAKVASEDAAMKVRTNLAEYLEKGIVK